MSTVKAANLQNTGSGAPTFQNSSGTEIGQLCKAWVNFNGTGTVAIRDSFNVSSIADLGVGEYTINFTNALANANYAVAGSVGELGSTGNSDSFFGAARDTNYSDIQTTTSKRVTSCSAGGLNTDRSVVLAIIIGD
tara:strand:+ start:260 stop:667 length:408 start_codon:yes stop_codon:yes gene_type:complete